MVRLDWAPLPPDVDGEQDNRSVSHAHDRSGVGPHLRVRDAVLLNRALLPINHSRGAHGCPLTSGGADPRHHPPTPARRRRRGFNARRVLPYASATDRRLGLRSTNAEGAQILHIEHAGRNGAPQYGTGLLVPTAASGRRQLAGSAPATGNQIVQLGPAGDVEVFAHQALGLSADLLNGAALLSRVHVERLARG